ncbi:MULTISPECIES: integrase arm-type DNA-binding domain-containing protein [unclassified Thioalkalivibrio]|uniref:tyrosine-type recombinase/integrase n=1 Tax=unclassified Thioalkalivibrio TaxID=2621013 RepID=UPI000382D7E1|nr:MULTISPECIES: integrase arm-type DNA-binding domain-containing protein [unclassified Thioalkalivibrio]
MARGTNRLTDKAVRAAKHQGKDYKLSDGEGMFLHVTKAGRYWRLKFRLQGKERLMSLGTYPDTSLAAARERRAEARALIADGIDPVEHRRQQASEAETLTLKDLLTDWLSRQDWSRSYAEKVEGRLRRHILPQLGTRPASEITPSELLTLLRAVEDTGAVETARRCRIHVGQAYRYGIAAGMLDSNPAGDLSPALRSQSRRNHFPAVTDPGELAGVLRTIWGYQGTPTTMAALKLATMLLVRPGELRRMEWSELDLDAAAWLIPAAKMKAGRDHLVPLPRQAVEIIEGLRPWSQHSRYVFPGGRSAEKPLSENAMIAAMRRMGLQGRQSVHGFRATARTILDEVLGWRVEIIEHALAHEVRDPLGRAYNRASFHSERRRMLQEWADYLDGLREGDQDNVLPIRRA